MIVKGENGDSWLASKTVLIFHAILLGYVEEKIFSSSEVYL
jgi:hypothetical protein